MSVGPANPYQGLGTAPMKGRYDHPSPTDKLVKYGGVWMQQSEAAARRAQDYPRLRLVKLDGSTEE